MARPRHCIVAIADKKADAIRTARRRPFVTPNGRLRRRQVWLKLRSHRQNEFANHLNYGDKFRV
jgi:hypothetical protein